MFLLGPFPWRLPANSLGLLNFSGLVISTSPLEVKHLTDLNRGLGTNQLRITISRILYFNMWSRKVPVCTYCGTPNVTNHSQRLRTDLWGGNHAPSGGVILGVYYSMHLYPNFQLWKMYWWRLSVQNVQTSSTIHWSERVVILEMLEGMEEKKEASRF